MKVISILLGKQQDYMKYLYLICEWDNRAKDKHFVQTWPTQKSLEPSDKNVINQLRVTSVDTLLPIMHSKLGL